METVNNYLNTLDRDKDIDFETFYKECKTNKEDYEEALSATKTGHVIVLKRTVKERWTNFYHPQWFIGWNANMDIQIGKFQSFK